MQTEAEAEQGMMTCVCTLQGFRTAHNVLANVLRHVPLLGTASKEPCKVHLEATFYRVGAEEMQAANRGANLDQARGLLLRVKDASSVWQKGCIEDNIFCGI